VGSDPAKTSLLAKRRLGFKEYISAALTMSTLQAMNNKWAPPLRSVEETTRLLKPDSRGFLDEVKLCWREPGVLKKDSSLSAGVLNKKNLASLERALKKTPSRLKNLSVGWKHGGSRKPLIQLLQLFANHSGRPALKDLESIELVLAAWIPDSTLLQLLLPYAPQLKTLHIQATRMKVKTKKHTTSFFKNMYQSVNAVEYVLEEESVVKILSVPTLTSQLTNLTTLSFVDCDILDAEVDILLKFLWRQYSRSGLPILNLRSNRHMSARSLQRLVNAPVSERLDLSLCDITSGDAMAIARALQPGNRANWRQENNITLQELSMCGNYQLDEVGFVPLARCCPSQVQQWDLSYCDWNENQTFVLLEEMAPSLMDPSCSLKELSLQGAKINNENVCRSIRKILRVNRSLVKMTLDDPKYTMPMSILNMQTIVQGLKCNYNLQELHLDLHSLRRQKRMYPGTFETASRVYNEMEFFLILNRAGRGLLQSDAYLEKQAWMAALLKARQSGRVDVLFWLLRNGVVHLF